jgi:methylmalonyl-CoA/ethylmalonyl-CoA epimerase
MEKKSPFSNLHHIGLIVKDLEKAVKYYESIGMGPFKPFTALADTVVEQSSYGDESVDFDFRIRLIEVGGTHIELIQPVKGKTVNSDFLAEHGEGVNHLAFLVDDVEAVKDDFTRKGFEVVLTRKRAGGFSAAYIATGEIGGLVFEFIQVKKQ